MPMITPFRCNTTNTSEMRLHALQTTGCTRGALRAGGRLEWTKWIVSVDVVKEILPTQAPLLPLLTGLSGGAYSRKFSRSSCYSEFIGYFLGFLPYSTPRGCYEPTPRMPVACWRKRQAKATKCSPAKVAGSLSKSFVSRRNRDAHAK